jgi:hypothetical protein
MCIRIVPLTMSKINQGRNAKNEKYATYLGVGIIRVIIRSLDRGTEDF